MVTPTLTSAAPELDRALAENERSHPWVKPVPVSGLIYEVETGRLRRVAA